MHASLHEIILDKDFTENENAFSKQLLDFLIEYKNSPKLLRKHLERGINSTNEKRTCFITAPDFPLKSFEPGYFNSKHLELGLSGGDISWYKPKSLKEEYYFFYETKHPFSQWHKSAFKIDNLTFNSAEQYMMYGKAKLFNDNEIAEKIMMTKNVREQKSLGREVQNFDLKIWNQNALDIVYKGNRAKFEQNSEYLNLLLSTKGKTIAEASPYDAVWGIGLTSDNKDSGNSLKWKGTNWLGIVLTELRQDIMNNRFENGYWEREDYEKHNV
ncbi:NADAR family protein [Bizionia argentinensis JUB59]|uniref:NADAR family protein n=2 Tax=Bizionia TaxID=283785 RepID=G2EE16_9FLAO|nr:NADAR family protein [Bizionia argentinensis JUB59]